MYHDMAHVRSRAARIESDREAIEAIHIVESFGQLAAKLSLADKQTLQLVRELWNRYEPSTPGGVITNPDELAESDCFEAIAKAIEAWRDEEPD